MFLSKAEVHPLSGTCQKQPFLMFISGIPIPVYCRAVECEIAQFMR